MFQSSQATQDGFVQPKQILNTLFLEVMVMTLSIGDKSQK
jgi:hypothetical protein